MYRKVKLISKKKNLEVKVETGTVLIDIIRDQGFSIYSPCGGKGICGKCLVTIRGRGTVTACNYKVEADIDVSVPDEKEMNILSLQYKHIINLDSIEKQDQDSVRKGYGIAADIGTTTIVLYFVDMATGSLLGTSAARNPQSSYGADVLSRINYCVENNEGTANMQRLLVNVMNESIERFTGDLSVSSDSIMRMIVTGNTTMLHLIAGINPATIGVSPFSPVFTEIKILSAYELNLKINTQAEIILLLSVSAYVGADILSGLASIDDRKFDSYLYIDIGTNGEIALVTKDTVWACATAAGPAFEGAGINCGMSAVEGAIESFSEEGFKTIGDVRPRGICGSGLIDIVAFMLDTGKISSDGLLKEPYVICKDEYDSEIKIIQSDIREVQLAKAAIAAGMDILIKRADLSVNNLDGIFLAGGFGNYINISNAVRIGLLPAHLHKKYIQIGNAAGTGAILALKSGNFINRMIDIKSRIRLVELSSDEEFMAEFVANMDFKLYQP